MPAVIALLLARQFRQEAHQAQGFLTDVVGAARGAAGLGGLVLATVALTAAVVIGLFQLAGRPPGPDYPPYVD